MMMLDMEEICCLRLIRLCAAPKRVVHRNNFRGFDGTGNPYGHLIARLEQKGYVKANDSWITILDHLQTKTD